MTAGDIIHVQVEMSTLEVAIQETIRIPTSETLLVTTEMRELMVQLAPILLGEANAPPPRC